MRSEAEHVAPGCDKSETLRPEGPKYQPQYSALSGLRRIFVVLIQGRRPDKVGTCPWLLFRPVGAVIRRFSHLSSLIVLLNCDLLELSRVDE